MCLSFHSLHAATRNITQVLTRSIKEFMEKTEPTFRQNILEQRTLLYLRHPFKAPAFSKNLKQMAIVKYKLERLPQNEKMKLIYRLFGKQAKKGIVQQSGGIKLGNGCFMIPIENLENVTQILKQYNIQPKITKSLQTVQVNTQVLENYNNFNLVGGKSLCESWGSPLQNRI